jgi:hypothetical protein
LREGREGPTFGQLEALARAGIDLAQVPGELEEEAVEKFAAYAKIGQLV